MFAKYRSLFRKHKSQDMSEVFAHFYPEVDPLTKKQDYDAPFKKLALRTLDGETAWYFTQTKFEEQYKNKPPKLRNYLSYTFVRLVELEDKYPGDFLVLSQDQSWICFNTGLQDKHSADLFAIFNRYQPRADSSNTRQYPDWVYRGSATASEHAYRDHFGMRLPRLAWYSADSRDYIFDTAYTLDRDVFDHMFDRARERSGFPESATDESVRNYLRGAIENLIPKIKRNYKTAIPIYYVQEKRMQLLLPFHSSNGKDIACFLVERDDTNRCYRIKTILDMDQAYFAARLITRPDKEWLNP